MLANRDSALVVDDNPTDRTLVRTMLRNFGFRSVHEAEDGVVGRAKFTTSIDINQPYDLVVIDWRMPRSSGLELLKYLRQNLKSKKTKIIIMTATADKTVIQDAIAVGIDDFIVKPVEATVLEEKIRRLFQAPNSFNI